MLPRSLNGVSVTDPALGDNPVGVLMYSPEGFMSANLNANDTAERPASLAFPFAPNDSVSDWALVGEHALTYAGPFHIGDTVPATNLSGQIIHGPLTTALVPSFVGGNQVRDYTFFDDFTVLNLKAAFTEGFQYSLTWARV